MIRDIIVNLSTHEGSEPTVDYAISVASSLEAHITGIAFALTAPVSGLGYIRAQMIDERSNNEAMTKAIMERFSAASARAGVSAEQRVVSANIDRAGDQFARIAALRSSNSWPSQPRPEGGRRNDF
jgi:hypothetical protein